MPLSGLARKPLDKLLGRGVVCPKIQKFVKRLRPGCPAYTHAITGALACESGRSWIL
jgi:hypothetical protein